MSEIPSYKCLLLGDQGVGKLHLWCRILRDEFGLEYGEGLPAPAGTKILEINNEKKKIELDVYNPGNDFCYYESAARFYFREAVGFYFREAAGVVLVYDIANRDSFLGLVKWLEKAREFCGSKTLYMLLGNKYDLKEGRRVSYEEGKRFAKENKMMFFEGSCKTGENVKEKFAELLDQEFEARGEKKENNKRNFWKRGLLVLFVVALLSQIVVFFGRKFKE